MTNKKSAKKQNSCTNKKECNHKGLFAILIIVLIWLKPEMIWSQIIITMAAIALILPENPCFHR